MAGMIGGWGPGYWKTFLDRLAGKFYYGGFAGVFPSLTHLPRMGVPP